MSGVTTPFHYSFLLIENLGKEKKPFRERGFSNHLPLVLFYKAHVIMIIVVILVEKISSAFTTLIIVQ